MSNIFDINRAARRITVTLAAIAAVLVRTVHAEFAAANTPRGAGVGYLCDSLVLVLPRHGVKSRREPGWKSEIPLATTLRDLIASWIQRECAARVAETFS
jgi:hypothetical protein